MTRSKTETTTDDLNDLYNRTMDSRHGSCDHGVAAPSAKAVGDSGFDELELLVVEALLLLRSRGVQPGGHIPLWGGKRKRCLKIQSDENSEREERKDDDEERRNMRKAKVEQSAPSQAEANAEKALAAPPQGMGVSPKTPSRANERRSVNNHGDSSDSTHSLVHAPTPLLCDRFLVSKPEFKVERKAGVHSSFNRRGHKIKTHTEFKERLRELLLKKEKMEKEKASEINRIQLLRDQNKHLRKELSLKLLGKDEDQIHPQSLPISSELAQKTKCYVPLKFSIGKAEIKSSENLDRGSPLATITYETSNAKMILAAHEISCGSTSLRTDSLRPADSLSGHFVLPDLNIPLEDLSDNSSGAFDNQVFEASTKGGCSSGKKA